MNRLGMLLLSSEYTEYGLLDLYLLGIDYPKISLRKYIRNSQVTLPSLLAKYTFVDFSLPR